MNHAQSILFGVDLEDIRHRISGGESYLSEVPRLTKSLLQFLEQYAAKATFFAVGRTVEEFPELIQEIVGCGHELACHTFSHIPLNEMQADELRRDLERCLTATQVACGIAMTGFRAPFFSLTPATRWVYPILREFGFTYSSSILDARWPVSGWPNFESDPSLERVGDHLKIDGIVEVPITSFNLGPLGFPVAGGIYSRLLPSFVLNLLWSLVLKKQNCLSTYIHPYDIDLSPQSFRHPEFQKRFVLNYLMTVGRDSLLRKFEQLFERVGIIERYDSYISRQLTRMVQAEHHVA